MPDPYAKSRSGSLAGAFWSLLDEGRFCVPRCARCGLHRFPPTAMCPSCHSVEWEWSPVSGEATVFSWTVARRVAKPELADAVPYCLGVAELAEGPLVLGRIGSAPMQGDPPAIGDPLRLVVGPWPDGRTRYHFEPADRPT